MTREYQKGVEQGQAWIGAEVARNWVWPFAYDLDDLLKTCSQPEFDPETYHFCLMNNDLVSYAYTTILPAGNDGILPANLEFPRMLPGHEKAAWMLIQRACEILKNKGVKRVISRVSDMSPGEFQLAEENGFSITDPGCKVYFYYEMAQGQLVMYDPFPIEISLPNDLEECAKLASIWYNRPVDWCRSRIKDIHMAGIISHHGIRKNWLFPNASTIISRMSLQT